MKVFRKTMTRDIGMITEETWSYAFHEGFKLRTGLSNPFFPALIYCVVDGATELWEQDDSFAWFKGELLRLNIESDTFFNDAYDDYQEILPLINNYQKNPPHSLEELFSFIDLMKKAGALFAILYYSSYDEKTPEKIREKALAWRSKDELYDNIDRIIRTALSFLFPECVGNELVITTDDLKSIPSEEELANRMHASFFVPGERIICGNKNDAEKHYGDVKFIIDLPLTEEKEGILKGQIACKGKAKGKVRILRRKSQVTDFKEGEILVSPMTTPDFLPAMKKAAAIVTDEGGITCHASITSRELNKTCIIGTKHATQVFKDGDLIEVDANTGVVRKLS